MVGTIIDYDVYHHSGQNVVDPQGAAVRDHMLTQRALSVLLSTMAKWLFRLPHCKLWSNKCTRFTEDTMYVLILWSDWLDKSSLGKWFLKIVDMLKVLLCLFKLIWWWSFGVISLCDILGKSKDSNERGVFWNGKWDQIIST